MRVENGEFEKQVKTIADQLRVLADGLANDGLVTASGVVLMGRQMIRALWTRLAATEEAPPAEEKPPEAPKEEPTAPLEPVSEPQPQEAPAPS